MSCNCNTADPNCEPCAFCTPPGVKCLPDCNPEDPCPEKIDLCCIMYSGPDEPCSDITTGMPLCDLIDQFFEVEFPASECCRLEMSIDLLPTVSTTTTTTSTTTTTTIPCNCITFTNISDGEESGTYKNCLGQTVPPFSISGNDIVLRCGSNASSTNPRAVLISTGGPCIGGVCPTTTTTTSTTSTTTTTTSNPFDGIQLCFVLAESEINQICFNCQFSDV